MSVHIIQGDVRERLAELPADYFDCIVTSPPYFGLRDYGTVTWEGGDPGCDHSHGSFVSPSSTLRSDGRDHTGPYDGEKAVSYKMPFRDSCGKCGARRIDAQIGLEPTLDAYLETMVAVCRELRRVLKPSGVFFCNIGDSYATGTSSTRKPTQSGKHGYWENPAINLRIDVAVDGLKPKDLCLVPERLGIALQADGWWVRSHIIWSKKNPMPESCTDRPTSAHETIYMLTKSARYYYDNLAVMEYAERHETAATTETMQGLFGDENNNGLLLSRRDSQRPRTRDNVQDLYGGQNSAVPFDRARRGCEKAGAELAAPQGVFLHNGEGQGATQKGGRLAGWKGQSEEVFSKREGEGCNSAREGSTPRQEGFDASHADGCGMDGDQEPLRNEMRILRDGEETPDNGSCGPDQQRRASYKREHSPGVSAVQQHKKGQATTRNLRNVWHMASHPYPGAHFATFPPELAERCIKAGCPHGLEVLDPFAGSGTTGLVADRLGRDCTLIDLNTEYAEMALNRIRDDAPLFADVFAE